MHRTAFAALLFAVVIPSGGAAQIPDFFNNLQVLPKDITRNQLTAIMRGFANGLGVRCLHCHPGRPDGSLEGMNFASDSLETKRTARVMLQMVQAINADYIRKVASDQDAITVQCATCHRGVTRPETLDRIIARNVQENGAAAAVAEYRKLREEYYGSGSYDFTEQTLIDAAGMVSRANGRPEALELLALNLEFFPQSANTHGTMGQIRVAMGDTAAAIAAFERALELRPGDRFFTQQLARLRR